MRRKNLKGFTLVELLIYVSVFVVAAGLLTTILITTSRVENNEIVSTQVGQELNLVLDTVQRLVRSASLIECVNSGPADSTCSSSVGSNLKLRFEDSALDPTCVYLESNTIKVSRGHNSTNAQLCDTSSAQALSTNKVVTNSLSFTKFDNAGGHATVQIDAQMTYNSTNPDLQISKTLRSAVGRVSAATFDSDILPDTNNNRNIGSIIGSAKTWKDIFLSGLLSAGKIVVGGTTPSSKLLTITNVSNPTIGPLENGLAVVLDNGGGVYFKDEGSAEGKLESYQGNIAVGAVSNHPLQFWTNNFAQATLSTLGNWGLGMTPNTSKLAANGVIESTSGGFKFPDGTTQLTAASGGAPVFISSSNFSASNGSSTSSTAIAIPASTKVILINVGYSNLLNGGSSTTISATGEMQLTNVGKTTGSVSSSSCCSMNTIAVSASWSGSTLTVSDSAPGSFSGTAYFYSQ